MAYSTVPTVNDGDTWSAAQHNTYIRDNFSALWPYTTAGDMAVATSSTIIERLPIGSENNVLTIENNQVSWSNFYDSICYISANSISIPNVSWTTIQFANKIRDDLNAFDIAFPTTIDCTRTGIYNIAVSLKWDNNSTGGREVKVQKQSDGLPEYVDTQHSGGFLTNSFSIPIYMVEGDYFTVSVYQSSGASLNLLGAYLTFTYWGS